MADINEDDFKNWLETRKGKTADQITELLKDTSKDDYKNLRKEFDDLLKSFEAINSADPKGKAVTYEFYSSIKNEETKKEYDDFAKDLANITDPEEREKAAKEFAESTKFTSHQKVADDKKDNQDTNWIQEKIDHWTAFCNHEPHDPHYPFERVEEDVPANELKFNIYKDTEKTQLGATVHYRTKRDVILETEEGKVPDFEFFDNMVFEAIENDGVRSVNFANASEMTDDFKAKLAIACIKHNIPMEGFDGNVDLKKHLKTEEWDKLPEKTKKEIEFHDAKRAAKEMKEAGHEMTIDPGTDKSTAAIIYAACKEVGVSVKGLENFTKDSHGMFTLPAKEKAVLPKEVQGAVNKYNRDKKEENIEKIRAKTKNRDVLPEADRDTADRFNNVYNARQFINTFNKTDDGKKLLKNLRAGKALDGAIIRFVEDLKKQDTANGNNDNMMALFGNKTTFEEFNKKIEASTKAGMFRDIFEKNLKVLKDEATKVNEADKDTKKRVNPSFYAAARDKFLPR